MPKEEAVALRASRWSWAIRSLLAAYLAVILLMSFLESRLIYPAPRVEWSDWSATTAGETDGPIDVWIPSTDGIEVHGWYYDLPNAERAVLYCHGNGEQVADNHALMRTIRRELNAAVLIFDYRGYGKTRGQSKRRLAPREEGVIADGSAAQHWLAERTGRSVDEVVLLGRSLGGGVATALAAENGAGGLLLQDTFTRITDAAAFHYPWLPVRWFMRNRYDSLARIATYRGPLLVSHGERDRVVPFAHAKQLFDACPSEKKRFLPQPERGHDEGQPKTYWGVAREVLANSTETAG